MSLSSDQARALSVLAAQLQATDPRLAGQLTWPPVDGVPGAGHPRASSTSRGPGEGAADFLQVVGALILGLAVLLTGVYLRSSWLTALGTVAAIVLPVAAIWWVSTRGDRS